MIRFASSATKHGITQDEIRYIISHCGRYFNVPPPRGSRYVSERLLFLGDNDKEVALEIMAILTDEGDLLVIHADKPRKQYRARYEEGLQWRI